METSMELNGLKSDNRSSQQFCLRWNNHQVSLTILENIFWTNPSPKSLSPLPRNKVINHKTRKTNSKSPNKSIESTSELFLGHRSAICIRKCIPTPIFSEEFFYFGCYRMLLLLKKKKNNEKKRSLRLIFSLK
jgi:hypothetical protein